MAKKKDFNNSTDNKEEYAIEMCHITKRFPGIIANDDITLRVRKGEIHALLGENGAGKSTLMSILFGLYQPDEGVIKKDGIEVKINNPNDATALHIGMVHQHFKLVDVFTVLDNIILGDEPIKQINTDLIHCHINDTKNKFKRFWMRLGLVFLKIFNWFNKILYKKVAYKKIEALSKHYKLNVDLKAKISDITVGMQQRTEILKMLYRDNDILIFDEPTAVLTPQEIDELLQIMRNLKKEGKSILFISHKLNEIMAIADCVSVLRKGKYIGSKDISSTNVEELSEMMVGRKVQLNVDKLPSQPKQEILRLENVSMRKKEGHKEVLKNVSFNVRAGEIVCIAGIDGNGQTDLIYGITGLEKITSGHIYLNNENITKDSIRKKNLKGISHIPEDRHKHGLVLDYSLEQNLILEKYFNKPFTKWGFIRFKEVRKYANKLIPQFDIRCSQGAITTVRSMSGGNQQKAIIAREIDRNTPLLIAVQPTRGLDVGAIEYIHAQLVKQRDAGSGVLLVSLELNEVTSVADRILVMYEGQIVGQFKQGEIDNRELGLYMSGAKKDNVNAIINDEVK